MKKIMPNIKHIVHVMLENRSFDNLLGWLYEEAEKTNLVTAIDTQNPQTYHGLHPGLFNLDKDGNPQPVIKGTGGNLRIPAWDPHEVFEHIYKQCYTSLTPGAPNPTATPEMGGFYQDYYSFLDTPEDIMKTFTPDDLPVINGLARNFAVCDQWFASIPTQTNCNRAFAATGNSIGEDHYSGQKGAWVDNHFDTFDPVKLKVNFTSPTHWNILSDHGYNSTDDWMIYYNKLWYLSDYCYTRDLFTQIQDSSFDQHFDQIETFYERAKAGTLPAYSFIEPSWGNMWGPIGIQGNDYHPPTNVGPGEMFLSKLYQAVAQSPSWNETLLVITFDEHGGTYDHFPIATNATPPWENGNPAQPDFLEQDFPFDTFGVRVPAIFVSPQIQANTVFRAPSGSTPFDHTSFIATLLKWKGIDPASSGMGARVGNAPTFEAVLNANTLRTDTPAITPNAFSEAAVNEPANDLQRSVAARAILHAINQQDADHEDSIRHYREHVHSATTFSDLRAGFDLVMKKIHGQ